MGLRRNRFAQIRLQQRLVLLLLRGTQDFSMKTIQASKRPLSWVHIHYGCFGKADCPRGGSGGSPNQRVKSAGLKPGL
jgi:hypothetical protein